MRFPKIGIYAGKGSSHSWLWFVDLFEKAGIYDLVFLDESGVQENQLNDLDILVVSGGDTFAMAQSLGQAGGRNIRSFVEGGGIYMGSCAGAYLPMNSSKKPLDWFNFADVKITNLSKLFPNETLHTCKSCAAYGYDFVFHPVREAVALKTTDFLDSFFQTDGHVEFDAPLYGGPGMKSADPSWVLAVYKGFTPKTVFFSPPDIAEKTLMGNGAIVRVPLKRGCFYLLGPHLEHPGFKQANQFIIDALGVEMAQREVQLQKREEEVPIHVIDGKEAKELLLCLRRELSNSRIVAGSMEFYPVQWVIGQKMYDPQKIRVYLESMWRRLKALEKNRERVVSTSGLSEKLTATAIQTTFELRQIKQQIDADQESLARAVLIFDLLHILSISFFNLYFATLFKGMAPMEFN